MDPSRSGPEILLQEEGVRIPLGITDLESFRRWALGPDFPERGRIDWVQGRLEVDVSPEDLNAHGSPKAAIACRLLAWVHETRQGMVYIDRARISSPRADLSAEPDILVLLLEGLERGRAVLIPKASGEVGRFVEIEGAADLVVEVVSDSSTTKDRRHLEKAYFDAGVSEYWIVDARREPLAFEILVPSEQGFVDSVPDAVGFRASPILGRRLRLERSQEKADIVFFSLEEA